LRWGQPATTVCDYFEAERQRFLAQALLEGTEQRDEMLQLMLGGGGPCFWTPQLSS